MSSTRLIIDDVCVHYNHNECVVSPVDRRGLLLLSHSALVTTNVHTSFRQVCMFRKNACSAILSAVSVSP